MYGLQGLEFCRLRLPSAAVIQMAVERAAHLIPHFTTPLDHFWDRLLVHTTSRLANRIDDGKIRLQRIQCCDGSLFLVSLRSLILNRKLTA